ncbi:Hypothetical predicted protein [Olea europaea subsp. europaea]|uniref:Uncharacterized protein n=1 Tax=Olea europaea subsp. europaea TaxID=158383 RepID=A0A8S0R9N3_OLEEU|nr:Hypothetical predicted protein [Olea europaea subsp. europaea]
MRGGNLVRFFMPNVGSIEDVIVKSARGGVDVGTGVVEDEGYPYYPFASSILSLCRPSIHFRSNRRRLEAQKQYLEADLRWARSGISSPPARCPFQELIAEAVVAMQIYDRCLK